MTTHVYRLTAGQANSLRRRAYTKDMYFNPVQDADGSWFISIEQVSQCDVPQFAWVKTLQLVPYKPVPPDLTMFVIKP